ncbi:hypothetical protein ACFO4E_04255 [Nocardiopsis mangrovi]|uniref:Transmembrane protein n=1 Tax=Nocardiopsis mangrovi TaxID=1179818 RepID=A0ABV9DTA9_9ACTN
MTVPPAAARMRRISSVTANFNGLQGLALVPVALWLPAFGAVLVAAPDATQWATLALIPVFGTMALITRHYHHRFGRVRTGGAAVRILVPALGLAVFVATMIPVNLLTLSGSPIWPQGLQAALVLATMVLLPPLLRRRTADFAISRHWQVMCALFVLAALVPVGLLTGGAHPLNASLELAQAALMWSLGACFLIGGLLDHRLLVRSLGSPPAGDR